MKNIILFFLSLNLVFAQQESSTRSLTIYKDGFAVINEPIVWSLKSGKNSTSFTNVSLMMKACPLGVVLTIFLNSLKLFLTYDLNSSESGLFLAGTL